ncbi:MULTISPECIES: efflux RND transporter periplasmic adaptor subunit [Microbulbifer]|uniref:Efflux RND transporter periplasmic adaptor subunit n=1 Tax=Microbulbifer celer TaxID=435905 RepID=A0ABW3U858_9GAMM|nr:MULTISPECIES: efflux RND transporter periplasmic adaptor subunit [Microbulbifer]UFN57690.1 efflux RND transporter periplasmic adaptor subunit [Microbulbifer celer]
MNRFQSASRPALGLLLTAALGVSLTACSPPESNQQKPPRPAVVVQPTAAEGQLAVYPGEVRARHEPALAFRVGGEVTRRLVQVGDRVKKGQPLAQLDAEDLLLQRDSARAQLTAAEAEHRNAKSEHTRYEELLARKLVGESRFDAVKTRLDASAAQLRQARAQLEVAENQAAYAVLKAPRDGVIAQRMVEAGQVVNAGQTVFTLAAEGEREIRIDLPEQNIARFKVGQPVTLELWSRPGEPYSGQIRELSPAADPTLRTYEARVAFDNSSADAELGQSARVYVQNTIGAPLLSVPMSAVTADGDSAHLWKLDQHNFTLVKTPVVVANYGNEFAQIQSGLSPRDWIVAAGTQLVREGQRVRPVDRNNRPIEFEVAGQP